MSETDIMILTRSSPEILRRERSYQWAERCMERAIEAGNQHRAQRGAMLTTALHKRMDELVFSNVGPYRNV